jgi:hypothetical protein
MILQWQRMEIRLGPLSTALSMKSGVQTAGEGYLDKMANSSPSLDDILMISLGWMIFDEGFEVENPACLLITFLAPNPPCSTALLIDVPREKKSRQHAQRLSNPPPLISLVNTLIMPLLLP